MTATSGRATKHPSGSWPCCLDNIAQIRPQRLSIVGADRGTRYTIPPIQNIKINPWTLLSTLKEDMPEAMPVVFDFLHTTLSETAQSERTTA